MADPVPTPAELAAWREAHALTVEGGSEWDEWARVAHREWPRLLAAVEALREGIAERDGQAKQMVDEQMDLAEEVAALRAELAAERALHAACADRLSEAVTQLAALRAALDAARAERDEAVAHLHQTLLESAGNCSTDYTDFRMAVIGAEAWRIRAREAEARFAAVEGAARSVCESIAVDFLDLSDEQWDAVHALAALLPAPDAGSALEEKP